MEKENWHKRDKYLVFDEIKHKYKVNNRMLVSVSELISQFHKEFDFKAVEMIEENYEKWQKDDTHRYYNFNNMSVDDHKQQLLVNLERKKASADIGTLLHNDIEDYYNEKPVENKDLIAKEWNFFLSFDQKISTKGSAYRTEWRIYDEDLGIAGTIDMIYKKKHKQEFFMFDWKRSEKLINSVGNIIKHPQGVSDNMFFNIPNYYNKNKKNQFSEPKNLPFNSYYHYCLQQSMYKYILEKNYKITIDSLNLLVLHPIYDNYKMLIKLPYLENEVLYIINNKKEL